MSGNVPNLWPRFLVIKRDDGTEGGFPCNPFLISKMVQGVSRFITKANRQRDGTILVECPTKNVSDRLLRCSELAGYDVSVSEHRALNTSKGVVRCPEWRDVTELDLKEGLKSSGVSKVERLRVKRNGVLKDTNTFFITFLTAECPQRIKLGMFSVRVSEYVPSPLRCFKCQKFGHTSARCRGTETCRHCGRERHEGNCSETPRCVNCEGNHGPSSPDCPVFKTEKAVREVMVRNKLSYRDAKQKVHINSPAGAMKDPVWSNASKSYAAATSKSVSLPGTSCSSCGEAIKSLSEVISKLTAQVERLEEKIATLQKGPCHIGETSAALPVASRQSEVPRDDKVESTPPSPAANGETPPPPPADKGGKQKTPPPPAVNGGFKKPSPLEDKDNFQQEKSKNKWKQAKAKRTPSSSPNRKAGTSAEKTQEVKTHNQYDALSGASEEMDEQ